MQSLNPATNEVIEEFEDHDDTAVDELLDRAAETAEEWGRRDVGERQSLLTNVADVLRENTEEYAETATREMGKPIGQARAEVEKCAWLCEYYADRADEFLQDEVVGSEPGAKTKVSYEPLGVVLAVMPWNFPYWQVFRFAVPNLTAGNVGVLKHASNVPKVALTIQEIFEEAGYPEGAFTTLLVGSDAVDDVIADDRVAAATLTGSERAGMSVAETAGKHLKKTVLELGGSDPYLVLDDADLDAAAETGAWARTQNGGQSCIAAKRFVVVEDVYDEFLDRFVDEMESLTVGDPMDEDTDVGPQARTDLMEDFHGQVEASVDAGATLVTGGEPLDGDEPYYPPTVLTDVPDDCPASNEEMFGPAAAVFRVADESEAIAKANDIKYGLGASVWTEDRERGERLARELDAGMVFVNEYVKSDPRLPFGGVKHSGYGRELGRVGIREFVNRKTVWVE